MRANPTDMNGKKKFESVALTTRPRCQTKRSEALVVHIPNFIYHVRVNCFMYIFLAEKDLLLARVYRTTYWMCSGAIELQFLGA